MMVFWILSALMIFIAVVLAGLPLVRNKLSIKDNDSGKSIQENIQSFREQLAGMEQQSSSEEKESFKLELEQKAAGRA